MEILGVKGRGGATFLLCSPSWSAPVFREACGCCDLERDWREEI